MGIYEFKREDAINFSRELGFKAKIRGSELQFRFCPYCNGGGKKDDGTFSINLKTGQFKCLRASCGAHGNMITLAKDFNFSLGRDVDEYYNRQRSYRSLANHPRPVTKDPAVRYLEGRGISKAVTERYAITTQKDNENILVFPFYDENSVLQFAKYRKTDFDKSKDRNKEWCEANCKPILFGMDQCDPEKSKTLVMTEGQIDSLSVTEAGIENAVSVPTGAKGFTWVPYCWNFLNKYDELIVFGDYENGKISLLEEMKSRFHGVVKYVRPEYYQDCKDANDLLRKYGKDAVRDAVHNAVRVKSNLIKSLADVRRVDLSTLERLRSHIPALDRTLGGFYFGQLILITGERGDGKSTFASQMAVEALEAGYNVFFYSGEMTDWHFKAWLDFQVAGPAHLNGITKERPAEGGGTESYTEYHIDSAIYPQMESWYSEKLFLFDNTAIEDDGEGGALAKAIEESVRQYGCRVLFIDNLMTAIDDDMQTDIYRQQTLFARKLTTIARKYNILVFLVAHPRKRSGMNFSNDDVAGSSNITNLAGVVLRYMKPMEDDADPPDRYLQVWKNRLTGKLNKGIRLYYHDPSKRIAGEGDGFSWKCGWEKAEPEEFHSADDEEIPFD